VGGAGTGAARLFHFPTKEAHISRAATRALRALALALVALSASGCFRDRAGDAPEVTAAEQAAFAPPADSSLTPEQVDRYLRTTLAQVERIRAEGAEARKQAAAQAERARARPATDSGPRPRSARALWGDFVDASFVRAARKLGYQPAEMWYVRGRMSAVGAHLTGTRMDASRGQAVGLLREQAEAMRGTPGVTQAQIDAMLKAAEQAERQPAPGGAPPHLVQNLDALRRARPNLSPAAWVRVAAVASATGLSDLSKASQADAGRALDGIEQLYTHALENREPPVR
jgi:hypothetical protein